MFPVLQPSDGDPPPRSARGAGRRRGSSRCRAGSSVRCSPRSRCGRARSCRPTGSSPTSGARARPRRRPARSRTRSRRCASWSAATSSSPRRPATGWRSTARRRRRHRFERLLKQAREAEPAASGPAAGRGARPLARALRSPTSTRRTSRGSRRHGSTSCAWPRRRSGSTPSSRSAGTRALVGELEQLVATHPLRERLRGQLMLALYRCGRQAEALEVYRAARLALADELGLDPSPELQELERRVLRQDPELAAPAEAADAARAPEVSELRLVTVLAATPPAADDPEQHRRLLDETLASVRDVLDRHGGVARALRAGGTRRRLRRRRTRATTTRCGRCWPRASSACPRASRPARSSRAPARSSPAPSSSPASAGSGSTSAPPRSSAPSAASTRRSSAAARSSRACATRSPQRARPDAAASSPSSASPGSARPGSRASWRSQRGSADDRARRALPRARRRRHLPAPARRAPPGRARAGARRRTRRRPRARPARRARRGCADGAARRVVLGGPAPARGARRDNSPSCSSSTTSTGRSRRCSTWSTTSPTASDAPLLVLCLARPELERPLGEPLALGPLGEEEARAIVAGTAELDEETRERIVELAEGNALYAEQLASFAAEGGEGLPPTLEAVLAGRLGRLDPAERAVLQRAAVVGREFSLGAVAALADGEVAPRAARALARRLRPPRGGRRPGRRRLHLPPRPAPRRRLREPDEGRPRRPARARRRLDRPRRPGRRRDRRLPPRAGGAATGASSARTRTSSPRQPASGSGRRGCASGARTTSRGSRRCSRGRRDLLPAGPAGRAPLGAGGRAPAARTTRNEADAALAEAEANARESSSRADRARVEASGRASALLTGELALDDAAATLSTIALRTLRRERDERGLGRAIYYACIVHAFACNLAAEATAAEEAAHALRRRRLLPGGVPRQLCRGALLRSGRRRHGGSRGAPNCSSRLPTAMTEANVTAVLRGTARLSQATSRRSARPARSVRARSTRTSVSLAAGSRSSGPRSRSTSRCAAGQTERAGRAGAERASTSWHGWASGRYASTRALAARRSVARSARRAEQSRVD